MHLLAADANTLENRVADLDGVTMFDIGIVNDTFCYQNVKIQVLFYWPKRREM